MEIIITGKKGYISTALQRSLGEKGERARTVSFREGADRVDMEGCDAVIHCAAIVHKKEKAFAEEYDQINRIEAVRLAERAKKAGVSQFIFFSTMSVYGLTEGEIGLSTPCEPKTLYGKSKLAAEREILSMAEDSFRVAVLRPPMVYGRDCPGNFTRLKRLIKAAPVFPRVSNRRSMIYIGNLTECVYRIIKENVSGVVLPMDKEYVSTCLMAEKIAECMGKRLILCGFLGKIASVIPLGVFKKLFGSLYYKKEDAALCAYVDFDAAIRQSV